MTPATMALMRARRPIIRRPGSFRAAAALSIAISMGLAGPAAAQQPHRQSISRAELQAAGWTRLSEIVFAARGVARAGVEGITVLGNTSGLPTWSLAPGDDEWLVLVDGQPVPVVLGGARVLDLLPVSLPQLDSVTVTRTPTFVAGRVAPRGTIEFHTRRGIRGAHGEASHYAGNEVGDAGPFTFTPLATPNIDNSGPFHQARLAYGSDRWETDVAIRRWIDNLTDRRLAARYEGAVAPGVPDLWVRHLAPTLHARVSAAGGRHDLIAGTAQLRGTFFVPAASEDQSLSTRLTYLGGAGTIATPLAGFAYRVHGAQLRSQDYGAPLPATLAHTRRELAMSLDATRARGDRRFTLGVEAEHHALDGTPSAASPGAARSASSAGGFLQVARSGRTWWNVAGAAGAGEGGTRASGLLGVGTELGSATTVDASLAAESRPYGDRGGWVDLALFGLDAIRDARRTSVVGDLSLRGAVHGDATLLIAISPRRESGLRLLEPDSASAIPLRPPAMTRPLALTSAEARAGVELPLGSRVRGGAMYRFVSTLGGDAEVREAARSLPRHLLDADVTVMPVRDLRVRSALHLASRTRWRVASGDDAVPAVTRLDLSLEKWFVDHRLRAQLLARNLFNDIERYHPLGADFRLRVFAGLTVSF